MLDHKLEDNARFVACVVLICFAGSLVLAFSVVFFLLGLAFKFPETILTKVAPAIDDMLRIVEIVGSIFSPLLAFILGFYFSNERRGVRDRRGEPGHH